MRFVFMIFIIIHGLIHLIGFAKAFNFIEIQQWTHSISKSLGLLWMLAAILFIIVALLYGIQKDYWVVVTFIAIVVSQTLIIIYWKEAKFGTIANLIILVVAILYLVTVNFKNTYRADVSLAMETTSFDETIISQSDLDSLPKIIQDYLNYVGVIGKPKLKNVHIIFEGEMREKGKDWFPFVSEQYNFFTNPTRLFFMDAKVKGVPTYGYHAYKGKSARMLIKVLSVIPIIDIHEESLYPTETVTYFNDLCLFAPAALIDKNIQWEVINSLSVKATFKNKETTISAILYFNEVGQLTNFESNDRYSISERQNFMFSTPVKNYKNINGYNLPTYGEAIWHYPDGKFSYGKFNLKHLAYNVEDIK